MLTDILKTFAKKENVMDLMNQNNTLSNIDNKIYYSIIKSQ